MTDDQLTNECVAVGLLLFFECSDTFILSHSSNKAGVITTKYVDTLTIQYTSLVIHAWNHGNILIMEAFIIAIYPNNSKNQQVLIVILGLFFLE